MKTTEDIKPFADLLQRELLVKHAKSGYTYPGHENTCRVEVKIKKKYANVDVGQSGRYMVVLETGAIYGIKGYGIIHKGHYFGTLNTITDWNWGGYRATRK